LAAASPAMADDPLGPTNDSPPTVTGPARWGATLGSTTGSWSSGPPITSYARQWLRCTTTALASCAFIPGATGTSYGPVGADVGNRIRIRVDASNTLGTNTAYSAPTAVVTDDPPDNSTKPSFSGNAREGDVLSRTSYGSWRSPSPTGYSLQWFRCDTGGAACAAVAGAIGDRYDLTGADVGRTIRLRVRATGPYGSADSLSDPSPVVVKRTLPPPEPSKPPRPRRLSPFPRIVVAGSLSPVGAVFRQVVVKGPRNVSVQVRCRGGGCPYRRHTYRMRRRKLRIRSLERRFRSGTVIELRVVKRGRVGKYTRIRIRRGRVPARLDRCLNPGSSRPRKCR
jgi:hypothetical protein